MQPSTNADIYWEDPLSFKKLKEGEQVTLRSNNGIVADFIVSEIQSEAIVLAPLGSDKAKKALGGSIVISALTEFGGRKLRKGDEVFIKYKDFPPKKYIVEYNVNNNSIFLKDPKKSGSLLSMILKLIGNQN